MHTNLVCAPHSRYFTHERDALAPSHVRTLQRRKRKKEKNASLHAFISPFLFNRKEIAHTRISKVHTRTHWRGLSSKQPLFPKYKTRCLLRQLPNFRLSRAHTLSRNQRRSAHKKCVRSPIQWQRGDAYVVIVRRRLLCVYAKLNAFLLILFHPPFFACAVLDQNMPKTPDECLRHSQQHYPLYVQEDSCNTQQREKPALL